MNFKYLFKISYCIIMTERDDEMKKVVILGGGTGMSSLLKGLKYFPVDITAIITVSDSGRSTGRLREEFSTPAVGDTRKVLCNLSLLPDEIKELLEYRFDTYSDLDGHPIGNLILTAALTKTGSLTKAIEYMSKLLDVKHTVLPLSEDCLTLMGETIEGEIIEGEEQITKSHKKYKRIFYKEKVHVLKEVIEKINTADLIIFSMGSLYTSIAPHLICPEVQIAIQNSPAKKMYICNAMTQPGETDNFGVSNHIIALEQYIGKNNIDVVIASNSKINQEILEKYKTSEQKDPVKIDYENLKKCQTEIIEADLLTTEDGTIKHNNMKLSSIIFSYLMR